MAGFLVALPQGLNVSGVTMWGVRLVNALASRGHHAGLILHGEPAGQTRLEMPIDPRVAVFDLQSLPPLASAGGEIGPWIGRYRDAVRTLAYASGGPVVVSPNLHGDCYGAFAAVAQVEPELLRVVGWQHSDIEYDARMLTHYEPMLHGFVAVSDAIEGVLRTRLPGREQDLVNIAYGVEVPPSPPRREVLHGRPIRLLYTGRLEHEQKRVRALVAMSDELTKRSVAHQLHLLGDGPASEEIDEACRTRPSLRRLPPCGPAGVRRLLAEHDAFVLASRYEGLSVSMLEALAQGCVPVVTAVRSGAGQALVDGRNGFLAQASPEDDDATVGRAMADAVAKFAASDAAAVARAAWSTAIERYSVERHADRVEGLMRHVLLQPPRPWPATRPTAFSGSGGGSGSVPAEGPARLRTVLDGLQGKAIVLHGAGRHTIELAGVLASTAAKIVAVADDDPARHGTTFLGWPVVAPSAAHETGATDVVISSWMHEEAIWSRRRMYTRQGLAVHRVYG